MILESPDNIFFSLLCFTVKRVKPHSNVLTGLSKAVLWGSFLIICVCVCHAVVVLWSALWKGLTFWLICMGCFPVFLSVFYKVSSSRCGI